ncbi:bifunctional SulP family inorganic anion transporter/carbonic anhydrase [Streptomyces tirandamycinicus]|uniref:bifunctional SulP family inorganic anion transporter/carbonic anhydrase n=1 Tax=Streptomyces tirandamycinicus TaxID=2174846 RepID=UPI00227124C4|nr:SulP family inorganic anion transporter [Streptomyces tirandamycinicus]MCY0984780.1 SulP family inorganic anion transporter [Streptomyces tirandamycinicus]
MSACDLPCASRAPRKPRTPRLTGLGSFRIPSRRTRTERDGRARGDSRSDRPDGRERPEGPDRPRRTASPSGTRHAADAGNGTEARTRGTARHQRPHAPPGAGPAGDRNRWPRRPGRGLRIASADLSASVCVFLIALPLSLGIALATGAPLQAGLVAAAVGGVVGGFLGGSPLQVSGPAAGLTVITADLIHRFGWRATCAITVLAGLTQLALAAMRVARSALAVSPAIVHGMLAGIGITIALAQLHIVLGGTPYSSALDNLLALPARLARLHPAALSVGAVTVALLLAWPHVPGSAGRLLRKAPAALAAVVGATLFASLAGLRLPRVDLPSWRSHALPALPEGPMPAIAAAVLTITLVTSVQSLLSAVAVDKLVAARGDARHTVHRSKLDRELAGQGAANAVSGALGGLPVAGVAVRSTANVRAGGVSRYSTILHGLWVALAALLLAPVLDLIPLAALAALVAVVGAQMVNVGHLRSVRRNRETAVCAVTMAGAVVVDVLAGVALGIAAAVAVALHRLTRTRVTVAERDGTLRIRVRGQLTFLAVPRLSRVLAQVPQGSDAVVELDGSFIDHAAHEALHGWRSAHEAQGGSAEFSGGPGGRPTEPVPAPHSCCRPWNPWRNHHCGGHPAVGQEQKPEGHRRRLASGLSSFQRNTAPLVRDELARLAREGQRPSQLFLTCADSRLVTSMITASGPGDLFTVRNMGNLVPRPGEETADDSVAAAIEYAVNVLEVSSITVCGHSGCGAMRALLEGPPNGAGDGTPLRRWLRHGEPGLARMVSRDDHVPRLEGRPAGDAVEQLSLSNVVQQLEHLRAHGPVARRLAQGTLRLDGMFFDVAEAQVYLLSGGSGGGGVHSGQVLFEPVGPAPAAPYGISRRTAPA